MDNDTCIWNPHGCQSLLGYGKEAHQRSGGICTYCGLGRDNVDVNVWKQMSVDHVLAVNTFGSGGLRRLIQEHFPKLGENELLSFAKRIDEINLVTACNFCNSMTSRKKTRSLSKIFPEGTYDEVTKVDDPILCDLLQLLSSEVDQEKADKIRYVKVRMIKLNECFEAEVVPMLLKRRSELGL